jgi:hypothetical protein
MGLWGRLILLEKENMNSSIMHITGEFMIGKSLHHIRGIERGNEP